MPQTKAAKKALRQTKKRTARSLQAKKKVEFLLRQIHKALTGQQTDAATKLYYDLQKTLDKAAKNQVFHVNKVNRMKSRLRKKIKPADKK